MIITATVAGLVAPVCALLLYGQASNAVIAILAVIVFAVGAASTGIDLTTKNYILELAPNDEERPFYIGVNDTLVGLPTMLLAATGLIVDLFGFLPVFIGIAALAIGGISRGAATASVAGDLLSYPGNFAALKQQLWLAAIRAHEHDVAIGDIGDVGVVRRPFRFNIACA